MERIICSLQLNTKMDNGSQHGSWWEPKVGFMLRTSNQVDSHQNNDVFEQIQPTPCENTKIENKWEPRTKSKDGKGKKEWTTRRHSHWRLISPRKNRHKRRDSLDKIQVIGSISRTLEEPKLYSHSQLSLIQIHSKAKCKWVFTRLITKRAFSPP